MPAAPFQLDLVWNREFDWVTFRTRIPTLDEAIRYAKELEKSGDGAWVKKTRIRDDLGRIVWEHGKEVAE